VFLALLVFIGIACMILLYLLLYVINFVVHFYIIYVLLFHILGNPKAIRLLARLSRGSGSAWPFFVGGMRSPLTWNNQSNCALFIFQQKRHVCFDLLVLLVPNIKPSPTHPFGWMRNGECDTSRELRIENLTIFTGVLLIFISWIWRA